MKRVTKAELERCSLALLARNVSKEVTEKDLQRLIKQKCGPLIFQVEFGQPYSKSLVDNDRSIDEESFSVAENGEERRQAFLNFQKKDDVERVMNDPLLFHQGQEIRISRYLPKGCPLAGYLTNNILLTIHGREIPEFDLKKYFEKFGQIVDAQWQNDDQMILQFAE